MRSYRVFVPYEKLKTSIAGFFGWDISGSLSSNMHYIFATMYVD